MVPGDGPRISAIDGMIQQASMGRSLKRIALVVTYGTLISVYVKSSQLKLALEMFFAM